MAAIMTLLHQEHVNLAKLLDAFEHQLTVFDRGEQPDYDVIEGVIDYCLAYPDRYHHPKEDLVLERLRARDPEAAAQVGDLEQEHIKLGELTRRMATAVERILNEAEIPRESFDHLAREFLATYRDHIAMEERVFFPAARRALCDEDWATLDQHVLSPGDPLFGEAVEERFAPLRAHLIEWDRGQA